MYHFNDNEQEVETVKQGNGQLICIQIGVHGIDGSRLFLYDGIDENSPLIAEIDMCNADFWLGFDCEFTNGLTYKTSANAGKFTVVFR
jgi:hypothetical protein